MDCCRLSHQGAFQLDHAVSSTIPFKGHSQFLNAGNENNFRKHSILLPSMYVRNVIVLISDYGVRHFQQISSCLQISALKKKKALLLFLYINIGTIFDIQRRYSSVMNRQNQKNCIIFSIPSCLISSELLLRFHLYFSTAAIVDMVGSTLVLYFQNFLHIMVKSPSLSDIVYATE